MMPERLPVEDCFSEITDAMKEDRPVILQAPPGAGKTTGVPPFLLERLGTSGKILLLQPRRIAARAAAHRLSFLAGQSIGNTFGYHVRFDRKSSAETRVLAMTTGILLQRLKADPFLEDTACVILDEFHERSLEVDLALGMLCRLRTTVRPELQLVAMSATLDTAEVNALIPDAVTVQSQGRAYDVDVRYVEEAKVERYSSDMIAGKVCGQIPRALQQTDGDALVFLPGVGEIHRTAERLAPIVAKSGVEIHKLYGDLSPQEQDAVLSPSSKRKIVLATNVAETSVTIPGITCVIDSGLARVMQYDSSVGLPALRLGPISKASADQRAGRAGRTAPGVCIRLWSKAMHRSRPDHTPPEVARADLSAALLTLAAWGEREVADFPWVTKPPTHAVDHAHMLLVQLGALDEESNLTELGGQMNRLPVHPRLARLLLAAQRFGCLPRAGMAAALLSERDPFERGFQFSRSSSHDVESDLINRLELLEQNVRGRNISGLHPGGAKNVHRVAKQLCRMLDQPATSDSNEDDNLGFSRALLAAYPDRLAKRRKPGSASGRMVGGRGVRLESSSAVRSAELFLCIAADGKGSESSVRMASEIRHPWLPSESLTQQTEVFFHPTMKAVVARNREYFFDLCLSESPAASRPNKETAAILAEHAKADIKTLLPAKDKALQSFLARWRFLEQQSDATMLPAKLDSALDDVLENLCSRFTSYKELSQAPWLDYLKGCFDYEQLKWFQSQAPESIEVPSGNRIHISYQEGKPPVLAVRIQEVFGWKQTPRLAGGRVPVLLHLLAPNRRPQQVTDDLESFWATTYHQVRKDLKRRYSKHHWPEDPVTAKATHNGLKPR